MSDKPTLDWFKNDIAGNLNNYADVYQDGNAPEEFGIKPFEQYWKEAKPQFEEQFGEKGEENFRKLYDQSTKRFQEYKDMQFDAFATSSRRMVDSPWARRMERMGYGRVARNPEVRSKQVWNDPMGRDIVFNELTSPKNSMREKASELVFDGENFVSTDAFTDTHDNTLVYAKDNKGEFLLNEDGNPYLRPLAYGEERKSYEEVYSGMGAFFGEIGLKPSGWWVANTAPRNAMNFVADVLDSGAELLKTIDRFAEGEGAKDSAYSKSLNEFQNTVNKYLSIPISDKGQSSWLSPEGFTDGVVQIGAQLAGMVGAGKSVGYLSKLAKFSPQASQRASSIASRMFMATLAADGLAKEGTAAGLTQREIASVHALSMFGFYHIGKLSEWVVGTSPAIQKATMNAVIKNELGQLGKSGLKQTGKLLSPKGLRALSNNISNGLSRAITNPQKWMSYGAAALTESGEEVSEALMEQSIREVFNRVYKPMASKIYGDDYNKDARFNIDYAQFWEELKASAVLGGIGGAVGKRLLYHSKNDAKSLYDYAAQDKLDKIEEHVARMESNGGLGNASLDANGKPWTKGSDTPNQNQLAAQAIRHQIAAVRQIWDSKGLNVAFKNNDQKLAALNNSSLMKHSSLGNDLSESLKNLHDLEIKKEELEKATDTKSAEQLEKVNKEIETENNHLEQIRDGKYATKYAEEVVFRFNNEATNLAQEWKIFSELNQNATQSEKSNQQRTERLTEAEKQVESMLNATRPDYDVEKIPEIMSLQTGEALEARLDEAFANEEIEVEQYAELKDKLYQAVKKGEELSPDGMGSLLHSYDDKFNNGRHFVEVIQDEEEKLELSKQPGQPAYDDLEGITKMVNQVDSRIKQLGNMNLLNEDFNKMRERLGIEERRIVPTEENIKQTGMALLGIQAKLADFQRIARENRNDFSKVLTENRTRDITYHVTKLDAALTLFKDMGYEDINVANQELLKAQDAEGEEAFKHIVAAEKGIYEYFKDDRQTVIAQMQEHLGLSTRKGQIEHIKDTEQTSPLFYAESLVTLDPDTYYSHYKKLIDALPNTDDVGDFKTEAKFAPSYFQSMLIRQAVASLTRDENVIIASQEEHEAAIKIVNGAFMDSWQASGKTLSAAVAARTAQMIKGGKILTMANDAINRNKMAEVIKELGGEVDGYKDSDIDALLAYLDTSAQSEVGIIVIDEATLFDAESIKRLDRRVSEINAGRESGNKMQVLYSGDTSQIGAINEDGSENDIGSNRYIKQRLPQMKFSYRSGNEEINSLLVHLRRAMESDAHGLTHGARYDDDNLSGVQIEEGEAFDTALEKFMSKMTDKDDYVVIANKRKISEIRQKHNIPDHKIMTPSQAQGKQWKYVAVDLDIAKNLGDEEINIMKSLLASSGRAKDFLLMRTDNTIYEGYSRNLFSNKVDQNEITNYETSFDEQVRNKLVADEKAMYESIDIADVEVNTKPMSNVVTTSQVEKVKTVTSYDRAKLTDEKMDFLKRLVDKLTAPKGANAPSNEQFWLLHSFYSYTEMYDADGNFETITSVPEIQRIKKQLIYPNLTKASEKEFDNVKFSLEVDEGQRDTFIRTEDGSQFPEDEKRLLIFATLYKDGKRKYKMSVGALPRIDADTIGITKNELPSGLEVEFGQELSDRFYKSFAISTQEAKASPEQAKQSVILKRPKFKARSFDQSGRMKLQDFKDLNKEAFSFSSQIYKATKSEYEEAKHYIFYSMGKTTAEIDDIVMNHQDRIGKRSGVMPLVINDNANIPMEEVVDSYNPSIKVKTRTTINKASKRSLEELILKKILGIEQTFIKDDGTQKERNQAYSTILENQKKQKLAPKSVAKLANDILSKGALFRTGKLEKASETETNKRAVGSYRGDSNVNWGDFLFKLRNISKGYGDNISSNDKQLATELYERINNEVFPYGMFVSHKSGKTPRGYADSYAPLADQNFDPNTYEVSNIKHPPFPVFKLQLDFIKEALLSSDSAFTNELRTQTKFVSNLEEKIEKDKKTKSVDDGSDVNLETITVDKDLDSIVSSRKIIDAAEYGRQNRSEKASLMTVLNQYFNGNPYNQYYDDYIRNFRRGVYNRLFTLTTTGTEEDIPRIVTPGSLNETINALRQELGEKAAIIDEIVADPDKDIDFNAMMTHDATRQDYYDYVSAKEFDFLINNVFESLRVKDGVYSMNNKQYQENQMTDVKETISHLETGSDLVKFHLNGMPILETIDGDEDLDFERQVTKVAFNKEHYSMIIDEFMELGAQSIDELADHPRMALFQNATFRTPRERLMGSFYLRFLAPEPVEVDGQQYYSFRALQKQEGVPLGQKESAEEILTALTSFLKSGTENKFVRGVYNGDISAVEARLTGLRRSNYRGDLEEQIANQTNSAPFVFDRKNKEVRIEYVKNGKNRSWTVSPQRLVSGDRYDLHEVMLQLGLGSINNAQRDKVLDIETLYPVMYEIGKYLSVDEDNRRKKVFKKGTLADWTRFVEDLQEIKEVESAYGYTTISGNKVNLLSLASPITKVNNEIERLSQRIIDEQESSPLSTNALVRGVNLPVDEGMKFMGIYIKEGLKGNVNNKGNSSMNADEHMDFDLNNMFIDMLISTRSVQTTDGTVRGAAFFNTMAYSDKPTDYVPLLEMDLLYRNERGLDMTRLKNRAMRSVAEYNVAIAKAAAAQWQQTFQQIGARYDGVDLTGQVSSNAIREELNRINEKIMKLNPEQVKAALATGIVNEIHYKADVNALKFTSGIKGDVINYLTPGQVQNQLNSSYNTFLKHYEEKGIRVDPAKMEALGRLNIETSQQAMDVYYWNWIYASHNFNTLGLGPNAQYKGMGDTTKRSIQITTNQQALTLRESMEQRKAYTSDIARVKGRKLGATSKQAIITDMAELVESIAYVDSGGHYQEAFDGAAFHTLYSQMQMKASYGNKAGFNVGANLKPISTHLNINNGTKQSDKYASFLITPQMVAEGAPFIKKMYELSLSSVNFNVEEVVDLDGNPLVTEAGTTPNNLFELEQIITAANPELSYEAVAEIVMDTLVENNLQDEYINEMIFSSSVKTGVSNLNVATSQDEMLNTDRLAYHERDNHSRGLVLDASHDPDKQESTYSTQIMSTLLQKHNSTVQAQNVMEAIARIGELERAEFGKGSVLEEKVRDITTSYILKDNRMGMASDLVTTNANYSLQNKSITNIAKSQLSAKLSDATVRFKISGGQQVVAPAYGVYKVTEPDGSQRELKGFDATFTTPEGNEISITDTAYWIALRSAVDGNITQDNAQFLIETAMNNPELPKPLRKYIDRVADKAPNGGELRTNKARQQQLRELLHDELSREGWTIQQPEVVISPIHFKKFGIPETQPNGRYTQPSDVTAEFFARQAFDAFIARRLNEDTQTPNGLQAAQANGTLDTIVEQLWASEEGRARYLPAGIQKFEDFQKTLDVIIARIPATGKQNFMNAKVVGFAHGSDNTFYTNLELLYLQGADQDIDKGNMMTYTPDADGRIIVPETLEEAGDNITHIKNFMVKNILDVGLQPSSLIELTSPTTTKDLKSLSEGKQYSPYLDPYNPGAIAEYFELGQAGKSNIGIHAVGLKGYSSLFYHYRKANQDVANYVPVSKYLSRDGEEHQIAGLFDKTDAVDFYSQLINASADNAKDPILGILKINESTGSMVNAMALFGYSPKQIVDMFSDPVILQVFEHYKASQRYVDDVQIPIKLQQSAQAVRTNLGEDVTPEIDALLTDFEQYAIYGDDFRLLGGLLGINQEISNSYWDSYNYRIKVERDLHKKGFTDFSLIKFISDDDYRQDAIARMERLVYSGEVAFNYLDIYTKNENIFSFAKGYAQIDEFFNDERMFPINNTIHKLAKIIENNKERTIDDKIYRDLTNFVYGLAVDEFLSQDGGMEVKFNNQTFNLSQLQDNESARGRISFMREFPNYFMGLSNATDVDESLVDLMMVVNEVGETVNIPVLKTSQAFLDAAPEVRAKMMNHMENVNEEVSAPSTNSIYKLLHTYALIKDKGGNSPTSLTALFGSKPYQEFDMFLQNFRADGINVNPDMEALAQTFLNTSPRIGARYKSNLSTETIKQVNADHISIPYKNDSFANDSMEASYKKASDILYGENMNVDQIKQYGEARRKIILPRTGHTAKSNELKKLGYILYKDKDRKGSNVWVHRDSVAASAKSFSIEDIAENPNQTYVLEDTDTTMEGGRSAPVLSYDNAKGIRTRISLNPGRYSFIDQTDDVQLKKAKKQVTQDIQAILAQGKPIVLPEGGIGNEPGGLKEFAPDLYGHLSRELNRYFNYNNEVGEIVDVQPAFEISSSNQNVQTEEFEDADVIDEGGDVPPPFDVDESRSDFEDKQRRRHFSKFTNNKILNGILQDMQNRFGTQYQLLDSASIEQQYGRKYSKLLGFVIDGEVVINADRANLDTPIHEMGHIWAAGIRNSNPELYKRIVDMALDHDIAQRVADQYPELDEEGVGIEIFATLFGLQNQQKALSSQNRSFFGRVADTWQEVVRYVRDMFRQLFNMEDVNMNRNLLEIIDNVGDVMFSSSLFSLNSNDVRVLKAMGADVDPVSTRLRIIQQQLAYKGLMEELC